LTKCHGNDNEAYNFTALVWLLSSGFFLPVDIIMSSGKHIHHKKYMCCAPRDLVSTNSRRMILVGHMTHLLSCHFIHT